MLCFAREWTTFMQPNQPEPTILIRAATPADLPTLSALWYEKMILTVSGDRRFALNAESRLRWEQRAAEWLSNPMCGFLTAQRDQRAVGYLIGWMQPAPAVISDPYIGIITEMVVDAHQYHAGAARDLVSGVRAWFAERDVHQLTVYASRRHAPEQAFWRSLGAAEWMELLWLKS